MDNFRLVIIGRVRSNYKGDERTSPEISTRPGVAVAMRRGQGRKEDHFRDSKWPCEDTMYAACH